MPSDKRRPPILPTQEIELPSSVRQKRNRFRLVGLLTPVSGPAPGSIRITTEEPLVIGRDPDVGVVIHDRCVSRCHARVLRKSEVFLLEDLDSFNGTFVDGVPILCCPLHDGDTVQLGRSVFQFERVLEFLPPDADDSQSGAR